VIKTNPEVESFFEKNAGKWYNNLVNDAKGVKMLDEEGL